MKTELAQLSENACEILGDDVSFLTIAYSQGKAGATLHGNAEDIAKALFVLMHQSKEEIASELYRIVESNIANILMNPSPLKSGLQKKINSILRHE